MRSTTEKGSRFKIPDSLIKSGEVLAAETRITYEKLMKIEDDKIICQTYLCNDICDAMLL